MDKKTLQKIDPINRVAESQTDLAENSPMDPPDAYSPPAVDEIPYESMPKFLQVLMDDHKAFKTALEAFEETLSHIRDKSLEPGRSINERLGDFFSLLDDRIVVHDQIEEKILFPVLHERLIEKGEHSKGEVARTAVDMLEDDHSKVMQMAAVTFNFMGLAGRLEDAHSRAIVLDAALEQGTALIELMRLHIFREDTIVFGLAVKHCLPEELEAMEQRRARITG